MMKTMIRFALVLVALNAFAWRATAQEPEVSEAAPMKPKAAIRLPKYFASLVNDVQRQEINQIQLSYRQRLQALEEQLVALKAEELAEAEQILSKGQREQLEEMRIKGLQRAMPRSQPASATSPAPAAMTAPAENSATMAKSSKAKGRARTKPSEPVAPKVD